MKHHTTCPCGSNKLFHHCCHPYISATERPKTPEALMRSRYTAYTQANIVYIQQTMCGPASVNHDPVDAKRWAEQANWLGLKVIKSVQQSKTIGYVEFIARYHLHHQEHQIHECSEFHYINDRWYYVDGKIFS